MDFEYWIKKIKTKKTAKKKLFLLCPPYLPCPPCPHFNPPPKDLSPAESNIAHHQIEALKQWAAQAGARTASNDVGLVEELKQYSIQQGIDPLEVD